MPWAAAAGAVAGALITSNASKSAASAQADAADRATDSQERMFNKQVELNQPFYDTGVASNSRLKQLLGLDSSYTGADSGSLLKKFSSSDLEADPVYQSGLKFGLDQGTNALNAAATRGGSLDSGATLKALTRYANDYGSTKANESYNRYNTDQTNTYNRLAGISGTGQTASNQVSSAAQNYGNQSANLLTQAGNANAAGIVGSNNAWGDAISGLSSAYGNYKNNQYLQSLIKQNQYNQAVNNYNTGNYPKTTYTYGSEWD